MPPYMYISKRTVVFKFKLLKAHFHFH